jgi:membrane-bound lytic murein transglycosylase F
MHEELDPAPELPSGPQPEPAPDDASDARPLPDALRNWQVVEIDGHATPISNREPGGEDAGAERQIADRQDDFIVASIDVRQRQVEAGAPAAFTIKILNNGPQPAAFAVSVEGWIDPQWVSHMSAQTRIAPGERTTIRIELLPPRQPETEAGDYHLGLVVRAPEYPERVARVGAVLTVLPFDALEIAFAAAPEATVSWLRRSVVLPLTISNRGNRPAAVHLHGADPLHACTFDFGLPADAHGVATLPLRASQAITMPVRVTVQHLPLMGLHGRTLPLAITARLADAPVQRRARTQLVARPIVGPWQMVTAAGVTFAGALGLALLLVVGLLLMQRSQAAAPVVAPAPAVAAPPVIIVNLSQPASAATAGDAGQGSAPIAGTAGESSFTASDAPNPALPMVLPDQVTTPGTGGVTRVPAIPFTSVRGSDEARGVEAVAPLTDVRGPDEGLGTGSTPTYAQMFQEIGQRYDLDWKMLAAQAYVESGFDSLALSDAGAMGLMQIVPDTWREWAPAAEVSDPFDSYSNVLVAAIYLDHLRTNLAGKGFTGKEWMLVAYNWGPDRLADFLVTQPSWEMLPDARRQYVTEILRIAQTIP